MIDIKSPAQAAKVGIVGKRSRTRRIWNSLRTTPGYTLMRGAARFASVRQLVAGSRRLLHGARRAEFLADCEARMAQTHFPGVDRAQFVKNLRDDGVAFGLTLAPSVVQAIHAYAAKAPVFADRVTDRGFLMARREQIEQALGKPVLLAQYFNTASQCPDIAKLVGDPMLQAIACDYLESMPVFVGANLWWTFPVDASAEDRAEHAHFFHRDVDDFRFFKFFFYLTDVQPGDGGHVCVLGSHKHPPGRHAADRLNLRRYSDEEIARQYPRDAVREICGPAGTGFAENTLCAHKGRTPTTHPRLLLQLQFALRDYGVMHDRRDPSQMSLMV